MCHFMFPLKPQETVEPTFHTLFITTVHSRYGTHRTANSGRCIIDDIKCC